MQNHPIGSETTIRSEHGISVLVSQTSLMSKTERFANATDAPVPDNTNILTAGRCGPALVQDIWLIEEVAHLDAHFYCKQAAPVSAPQDAMSWGAAF
jgi:hypothetical protein